MPGYHRCKASGVASATLQRPDLTRGLNHGEAGTSSRPQATHYSDHQHERLSAVQRMLCEYSKHQTTQTANSEVSRVWACRGCGPAGKGKMQAAAVWAALPRSWSSLPTGRESLIPRHQKEKWERDSFLAHHAHKTRREAKRKEVVHGSGRLRGHPHPTAQVSSQVMGSISIRKERSSPLQSLTPS